MKNDPCNVAERLRELVNLTSLSYFYYGVKGRSLYIRSQGEPGDEAKAQVRFAMGVVNCVTRTCVPMAKATR